VVLGACATASTASEAERSCLSLSRAPVLADVAARRPAPGPPACVPDAARHSRRRLQAPAPAARACLGRGRRGRRAPYTCVAKGALLQMSDRTADARRRASAGARAQVCVAAHDGLRVRTWALDLAKGARDRAGEEAVAAALALRALAAACGVPADVREAAPLGLLPGAAGADAGAERVQARLPGFCMWFLQGLCGVCAALRLR
jgi:hypothetical protein